jgi:replicative DNA helicase
MFSPGYQIKLLALLTLNKEFTIRILPFLKDELFSTFIGKVLYHIINNYFSLYNLCPTPAVVEQELTKSEPILLEEQPLLDEFLLTIRSRKVPEEKYIKDTVRQFVSARQLRLALNIHSDVIEGGDFNSLIHHLREEENSVNKLDTEPISVFDLKNLQELYEQQGGMRTGISLIDEVVGGILRKELTILLADTNIGKSLALCAMGGSLLRNNYRVLHVTLEMSVARTLVRYFTTLAEPNDNIIYHNVFNFEPSEHVFNYVANLKTRYDGFFHVEEFPTGKATIGNLSSLVNNHKTDVLILDYLDLLKPTTKREARRFELAELAVSLRGLAVESNISVLTATQTSRQAANKRIIGKELVAEDYEKVRVADTIVGLGQSREDALRHEVVLYLTKSRNTERDKAERYFIDFNTMRLRLIRRELLHAEVNENE